MPARIDNGQHPNGHGDHGRSVARLARVTDPRPPLIPGPPQPVSLAHVMPAPQVRRSRMPGWAIAVIVVLAAAVLAVGGVAAVALTRLGAQQQQQAAPNDGRQAPLEEPEASSPPVPEATWPALQATDIVLTVKVTKKDCFGSAGCLVEFQLGVDYAGGRLKPGSVWSVTYEVRGGKEQQINTFRLTAGTTSVESSVDRQENIQTPSSGTTLTAVVTSVAPY